MKGAPMLLKRAAQALVVCLASATVFAQATDPMIGTWKLNTAKSKSPYKTGTTLIEAVGDAIKVTADLTSSDATYHWTWTAKYGGPEAPVTGTTPFGPGATASLTKVDAHTVKVTGKRDGK